MTANTRHEVVIAKTSKAYSMHETMIDDSIYKVVTTDSIYEHVLYFILFANDFSYLDIFLSISLSFFVST